MSPKGDTIADPESETKNARRGRPSQPLLPMLGAADALFAAAESPYLITMDAIAAAANVGKGTLFRAFGSRDGLLDALWALKLEALHHAFADGPPPLGPAGAPLERALTFLEAVLTFKLENRHLIRAREAAPGILKSEHYRWMHGVLRNLMTAHAPRSPTEAAGYAAHTLLVSLHIDLIEELLDSGLTPEEIRKAQAAHVNAVFNDAHREGFDPN